MANIELLNNQKHKDLRVLSQRFSSVGCDVGNPMIMPSEFTQVQREYPILFRKDSETGQFYSTAMLGFASDENLFLSDGKWQSDCIPLTLRRGPFLIGFQEQKQDEKVVKVPVIYVDVDDPRISQDQGEPIFTESGDRGTYMEKISNVLMDIHQGVEASKEMISAFTDLNLIEPVSLGVELKNGENIKVAGIYTINEETLSKLEGAALEKLNNTGFLRSAFCVVNSLDNFKKLIDIRNSLL